MLDYHVILDLMPTVAGLYFQKRLGEEVKLTAVQSAILLAVGLQRKTVEEVEVRRVTLLQIPCTIQQKTRSRPNYNCQFPKRLRFSSK